MPFVYPKLPSEFNSKAIFFKSDIFQRDIHKIKIREGAL